MTQDGFNGAAALQRRRHPLVYVVKLPIAALQWGRRSSATETLVWRCRMLLLRGSFNGAAALQRRRHTSWSASVGLSLTLQWGRRSSATETVGGFLGVGPVGFASMGPPLFSDGDFGKMAFRSGGATPASMGPPLFSDGDLLEREKQELAKLGLQWGRRSSATETSEA